MEALFSQLSVLANDALDNKDFNPSRIEELLQLFELEAGASLAAAEAEHLKSAGKAEAAMKEAENQLNSILDAATEDFPSYSAKVDSAAGASENYMEAALAAAMATMKFTFASSKIQPS
ncbi:hypothetical protein KFK09_026974 [Dendrobium nobile]|uniref:Uncharacterized protein n=1 Tax=Dendrobium nobile TaxID=94219 RepID=A0A8T3A989_DENNO|nr:hypothetical protein KFK09_026974 [Dendrobium nobile]